MSGEVGIVGWGPGGTLAGRTVGGVKKFVKQPLKLACLEDLVGKGW